MQRSFRFAGVFSCVLCALPIAGQRSSTAARNNSAHTQPVTANQSPASKNKPEQTRPNVTNPLPNQVPDVGADYVPCKFTYSELQSLVEPERKTVLSEADAERLFESILVEIKNQESAKLLNASVADAIITNLEATALVGLTPSQAIAHVLTAVQRAPKKPSSMDTQEKALLDAEGVSAEKRSPDQNDLIASQQRLIAASIQIANKAQAAIEGLMRPPDVSCAMSVLGFAETSTAFGRTVAKRFIAIQVVVRNLNRDQQFLLHDVEFAANVDPNGRVGRFYSGRDKVLVRASSVNQEDFDIRNLSVHTAEGVGALMSAASLVYGGALTDASNVFTSAFVPTLGKVWKDKSVDQLNLLNDTGFSSTSSSQMVVPKNATTMFVTFIPEKQFEQGWWARPCASRQTFADLASSANREYVALSPGARTAGRESIEATGYDVAKARESCLKNPKSISGKSQANDGVQPDKAGLIQHALAKQAIADHDAAKARDAQTQAQAAGVSPSYGSTPLWDAAVAASDTAAQSQAVADVARLQSEDFVNPMRVPYRKWSGTALAIFQELSTAVVAGMHIIDDKALAPAVTEVHCNLDDKTGKLQFPVDPRAQVSCAVVGKNLDKVKALRLRNLKDPSDPDTVDGALTLGNGDNGTATATFSPDALHGLTAPDYGIKLVDKTGLESGTGLALHFDLGPYVVKYDPVAIDPSIPPTKDLDVTGFHLSDVASATLQIASGKTITLTRDMAAVSDENTLHLSTKDVDWTPLGNANAKATVILNLSDGSKITAVSTLDVAPKAEASSTAVKPKPSAAASKQMVK